MHREIVRLLTPGDGRILKPKTHTQTFKRLSFAENSKRASMWDVRCRTDDRTKTNGYLFWLACLLTIHSSTSQANGYRPECDALHIVLQKQSQAYTSMTTMPVPIMPKFALKKPEIRLCLCVVCCRKEEQGLFFRPFDNFQRTRDEDEC
jgi:hypothetical protein